MLRPSYTELTNILNSQQDADNKITSRYTIVIAAAKRARQLIDGAQPLSGENYNDKAVSTAVKEMDAGQILITSVKDETATGNASDAFMASIEAEGLGNLS